MMERHCSKLFHNRWRSIPQINVLDLVLFFLFNTMLPSTPETSDFIDSNLGPKQGLIDTLRPVQTERRFGAKEVNTLPCG